MCTTWLDFSTCHRRPFWLRIIWFPTVKSVTNLNPVAIRSATRMQQIISFTKRSQSSINFISFTRIPPIPARLIWRICMANDGDTFMLHSTTWRRRGDHSDSLVKHHTRRSKGFKDKFQCHSGTGLDSDLVRLSLNVLLVAVQRENNETTILFAQKTLKQPSCMLLFISIAPQKDIQVFNLFLDVLLKHSVINFYIYSVSTIFWPSRVACRRQRVASYMVSEINFETWKYIRFISTPYLLLSYDQPAFDPCNFSMPQSSRSNCRTSISFVKEWVKYREHSMVKQKATKHCTHESKWGPCSSR